MRQEPNETDVKLGHQRYSVSIRGIGLFMVLFLLSAAVIHWVVWVLYRTNVETMEREDRPTSALATQRPPPVGPPLQPSLEHRALPREDMAKLTAREMAEFAQRGWVDAKSGQVRIPDQIVQRVIEMSAPRGPTTRP
jgi:hypothetical protein